VKPRRPRFYRPELDGLRFFAFLFVFIGHALSNDSTYYMERGMSWIPAHVFAYVVSVGRFGVPLFFVLSSYLITELLIREHAYTGTIDVGRFYLRRALRIWPLYFVVVLTAYGVLTLGDGAGASFPLPYLASLLLFFGNWAMAWNWGPSVVDVVSAPLWSVSVEEQFYLTWPLLLAVAGVGNVRRVAVVLIGVAIAVRLGMDLAGTQDTTAWYSTFTWLDSIGAGALLAVWLKGGAPSLPAPARVMLFTVGVGLWLLASVTFGLAPLNSMLYPLIVAGSVLMFLSATGAVAMRQPVLVSLGRMSYGLYVFHMVGLAAAGSVFPASSVSKALTGLVITVMLATASYRWLETPFLRLKRRFTYVDSRPVDGEDGRRTPVSDTQREW
jgi:peptidoglycan/LPS O-acetylase OafA/YrhL